MRWRPAVSTFCLAALLVSCAAKPLAPERADFAGTWHGGNGVVLTITADGKVEYARPTKQTSGTVSGHIQGWQGDDFIVGVMVQKTRFKVQQVPVEVNGSWRMTVNGDLLLRE